MKNLLKKNTKIDFLIPSLFLLFIYTFIVNAWICDDAFITFRTVSNFTQGLGLTWNPAERVQAYSHPLWMLTLSLFSFLTKECFYTSIALSFLLTTISFVFIYKSFKQKGAPWKGSLFILLVLSSKIIFDYTSSGLENPLSYFLATLFCIRFFIRTNEKQVNKKKEVYALLLIASIAFVNRADTLLLYLPALIYNFIEHRHKGNPLSLKKVFLSILPALSWISFALFYYGFAAPNTAYAKAFNAGVSLPHRLFYGLFYFNNALHWDTLTCLLIFVTLFCLRTAKKPKMNYMMSGVFLYFAYILNTAAISSHMSGRFLSTPFFIMLLILTDLITSKKAIISLTLIICVFLIVHPLTSIKMSTPWYKKRRNYLALIDIKMHTHQLFNEPNAPEANGGVFLPPSKRDRVVVQDPRVIGKQLSVNEENVASISLIVPTR
jgi:arabinofuranosyltransferase